MYRTGDLLVRSGLVTFPALADALASCTADSYAQLAQRWFEAASANEALLCRTLATLVQPHPVVLTSRSTFDLVLLDSIAKSHAHQEFFLPISLDGQRLRLLVTHPDRAKQILLPEAWLGLEVEPLVAVDSILRTLIEKAYQARARGESLLSGAESEQPHLPHMARVEAAPPTPSDLDALLGAFVASVTDVPAQSPEQAGATNSKRVLARIALQKRRAGDVL